MKFKVTLLSKLGYYILSTIATAPESSFEKQLVNVMQSANHKTETATALELIDLMSAYKDFSITVPVIPATSSFDEEYIYSFVDNTLTRYSIHERRNGKFGTPVSLQPYTQIAEFFYPNKAETDWDTRRIGVIKESSLYLEGVDILDNNSYKRFKKSKMLRGRIFYSDAKGRS